MYKIARFLLVFSLLFQSMFIEAQEQFDSIYSPLQGIKGTAQYQFHYDIDHLEVKSGAFLFESQQLDSAWHNSRQEQKWEGDFEENKKIGSWVYETKEQHIHVTNVLDYELIYSIETIHGILNANYKKGKPDGDWNYSSTLTTKNKTSVLFESLHFSFEKGFIDGPFGYEFLLENGSMGYTKGVVKAGLFAGKWEYKYEVNGQIYTETRMYENGILLHLKKDHSDSVLLDLTFVQSPQTAEWLENKKGKSHLVDAPFSLVYNDGYTSSSVFVKSQKNGEVKIQKALFNALRFDADWLKPHGLVLGANRGAYPLSEKEDTLVAKFIGIEQEYRDVIALLDQALIYEHAARDSILEIAESWIEKQRRYSSRGDSFNELLLSNEVENYYREGQIFDYAKREMSTDTLNYGASYVIWDYNENNKSEVELLPFMVHNYIERVKAGKRLISGLHQAAKDENGEAILIRLSLEIQTERTRLDSVKKSDKQLEAFLENINKDFLDKEIKQRSIKFANEKNEAKKQELGDSLLLDLYTVSQIYKRAIVSISREQLIDSLYTEYVFDAFTFTDNVPARKKKKLYNQFTTVIDYLVNEAAKTSTTEECLRIVNEIVNVQATQIFLNDKNTKQIEKELQRAQSVPDKLAILNEVI